MKKWARDVRLMPIVLIAIGCLFALKTIGLLFDGGYTLGQRLGSGGTLTVTTVPMAQTQQMRSPSVPLEMPPQPGAPKQPSWMQEMFSYPGGDRSAIAAPQSRHHRFGRRPSPPRRKPTEKAEAAGEQGAARCRSAPKASPRRGTVVSLDQQRVGVAGRARLAGAVAGAPPGARRARARARAPRKPAEGRGKEAGGRGSPEGDKASARRERPSARTSPRSHASRASSPCTRR